MALVKSLILIEMVIDSDIDNDTDYELQAF